jgi:choline-sulfatase
MPVQWRPEDRPDYPAVEYLAWMNSIQGGFSEELIRRVVAGYCGLITHTDEQIGQVLEEVERLGILEDTRVLYTSDHGEAAGHHGILGKSNLYEHALGVPLIMAGPDIPGASVATQLASRPAIRGDQADRSVFAEYHAMGSRYSSYSLREGRYKVVVHVDMPTQFFDLQADPREENDLALQGLPTPEMTRMEERLRTLLDPEATDARSKRDQRAQIEKFGGEAVARSAGVFSRSPIPGKQVEIELTGDPRSPS